jgi:hypothetical protein
MMTVTALSDDLTRVEAGDQIFATHRMGTAFPLIREGDVIHSHSVVVVVKQLSLGQQHIRHEHAVSKASVSAIPSHQSADANLQQNKSLTQVFDSLFGFSIRLRHQTTTSCTLICI